MFSNAEGAPKSRGLKYDRSWSSRTMPRHRPSIFLQVHIIGPLRRYLSCALPHILRCDNSILLQILTDFSRFKPRAADLKLLCPGHTHNPIPCFAPRNEPNACSVQFHYIFHYFRKLARDGTRSPLPSVAEAHHSPPVDEKSPVVLAFGAERYHRWCSSKQLPYQCGGKPCSGPDTE